MDPQKNVCSICKTQGHYVSNCPQLSDPLKNGFYSGGGGSYGGGDEED
jgi:hypothetical protein